MCARKYTAPATSPRPSTAIRIGLMILVTLVTFNVGFPAPLSGAGNGIRIIKMRIQNIGTNIRSQLGIGSGAQGALQTGGLPSAAGIPLLPPTVHSIPPVDTQCATCTNASGIQSLQGGSSSLLGGTVLGKVTQSGNMLTSVTSSLSAGLTRLAGTWQKSLSSILSTGGSFINSFSQSLGQFGQFGNAFGGISQLASRFQSALLGKLSINQLTNVRLSQFQLPLGGPPFLGGRFANFLQSNPLRTLARGLQPLGSLFQTSLSGALLSKLSGGTFGSGALAGLIRGSLQPLQIPLSINGNLQGLAGSLKSTLLSALMFRALPGNFGSMFDPLQTASSPGLRLSSLLSNSPVLRLPNRLISLGTNINNVLYGMLFSKLNSVVNQPLAKITSTVRGQSNALSHDLSLGGFQSSTPRLSSRQASSSPRRSPSLSQTMEEPQDAYQGHLEGF